MSLYYKGDPCNLISFYNGDITCKTNVTLAKQEYYGNRGFTIFIDKYLTNSNLSYAKPSVNASKMNLDSASYISSDSQPKTVWMKGFLDVKKTSVYQIEFDCNVFQCIFFVSNDSNSDNKVIV